MTFRYDPLTSPDSQAWLRLDESARVNVVLRHHKRARFRAGSLRAHAVIHVVVENQLASGHRDAVDALERLISQGLDRHEAVHAIGSVVATQVYDVLKAKQPVDNEQYNRRLRELTASAWRSNVDE